MTTRKCHEKGCNKLPTYNKVGKTSGKFCGEHKKDGMVSIMYRYYNNQMDRVFKMLPEALQWEILTDFVGGFAVRFNRLRRLMSGELQHKIMNHTFEINYLSLRRLWAKPFVRFPLTDRYHLMTSILNRWKVSSFGSDGQLRENDDPEELHIVAVAEFSHQGSCVVLFRAEKTGQLSYGVRIGYHHWYIRDVDDSITLPPYEKHIYPSYPYTNKKLGRPVQKMKLHNPIPKVPEGLNFKEFNEWMEGRRFPKAA